MIVLLLKYLFKEYSILNIRLRAIVCFLTSLFISLIIGNYVINKLKKLQIYQIIRNEGPKSHLNKYGTPTMGGLIIILSMVISVIMWSCISNVYIWLMLFTLISNGILGFLDDYSKILQDKPKGLGVYGKYLGLSIIAVIIVIFLMIVQSPAILFIPLIYKNLNCYKLLYGLLTYFIIVGTSNAVNIMDGLDGLAIMPAIFVSWGLTLIAFISGSQPISQYLHIPYIPYANELVIVTTSLMGAGLGFLWFNAYPAKIFMGDLGSLAIGSTIGTIAVLLGQEILFFLIMGLFFIVTLSVIIQVMIYKLYGRRIFLMSPIHHHFELLGWKESHIIIRFWIISLVFLFIGLAML